ncbi:MAG: VOC family protein [Bdellovibrionaceae bacterium]|nr:VOC family protein [Pseudobdellovibrionaceae bacterium]
MKDIVNALIARKGEYEGQGINHEGQPFTGGLSLMPAVKGSGASIAFTATGADGTVYHHEQSLIALNMADSLCLWNLNTNTPGLVEHGYRREENLDGGLSYVFGFGEPEVRNSFREEIGIDLWKNGEISYRYSWGMPGGDFQPRSSVRMKPKSLAAINHIIVMVSDMNKSVEFYESILGFKTRFRSENWTELDAGNITLALHGGGKPRDKNQMEPHESAAGTASINFDVHDVEKIYQDLTAKGVTFTLTPTVRQNEGIKLAVAQDLDGFEICFAQKL